MLKKLSTVATIALTMSISGCAEYSNWTPTVDTQGDAHAQNLSRDMQECKQLAKQASGGGATEAAKGTALGGLVGAAAGAALGAVAGSPGTGAALGAAAGGIGYGASKSMDSEGQYKNAYSNCMRNRGHNVIN